MLVATLFNYKIKCAVIQWCEKVIMHLKIVVKPYRTNAPLLLDLLCSGIWFIYDLGGVEGRNASRHLIQR